MLLLFLINIFWICRLKANIQKTWLPGRPPTSPKSRDVSLPRGRTRRSSAQSSIPSRVPRFAKPVLCSNRSRSLDGLLDAPPEEPCLENNNKLYLNKSNAESNESYECKENEADERNHNGREKSRSEEPTEECLAERGMIKSKSYEDRLDSDNSSNQSGSVVSLPDSVEEGKKKQNFMNKCVTKVKSLIRK